MTIEEDPVRLYILVVDDEPSQRETLKLLLTREGYEVATVASGQEALDVTRTREPDLILSDIRMPHMDGITLLNKLRAIDISSEIILLTAYANTEDAVEAMKAGAYDYLIKPYKIAELRVLIAKALEKRTLRKELDTLKSAIKEAQSRLPPPVAESTIMKNLLTQIEKVAPLATTVLFTGESGVGKEVFAKRVWNLSQRSDRPFVAVNCGAIPDNLVESELFGHQKGAYTGADKNQLGLFEQADQGTLFLDEIGELPLAVQVKLLRVLQEKKVRRLGSDRERQIDVRIICATNRDLQEMVDDGTFRNDLFYRINVFHINIPPLRERRADIVPLARRFLETLSERYPHRESFQFTAEHKQYFASHPFPGNVRELENWVERQLLLGETTSAEHHLSLSSDQTLSACNTIAQQVVVGGLGFEEAVALLESQILNLAMQKANGQKTDAAQLLGLSFRQLRYKLKKDKEG